jgi:staphyloferrin B biosynthesis citrate synthase
MGNAQDNRLVNPVLERMRSGGIALGMNVRLGRSGDIARIAKSTGHDFIFIDTQHALFDLETLGHIANAAIACGIAPLVRVRSVGDPDVSLLLDNGAMGIVFPDVNNAAEARRAVETCRFAPLGRRSAGGASMHFDFRPLAPRQALAALDAACVVVLMIETLQGLQNVEEIAAVKGVDVIHLGTNDLLVNMGKAGEFDHPEIVAAQRRVAKAAKANGIFAGCGGNRDVERQVRAIREGVQFLTTQTDIAFLAAAAGDWTTAVRKRLHDRPG